MDLFSAIGLAGNVITFLDFGYKLLSKSKAIYMSTSGTSALNNELALETQRLQAVTAGLQTSSLIGSISDQELALKQLATDCSSISSDLTQLLDNLKTRKPKSIRESIRTAFRDLKKKYEKDRLQSKLDRCRDQLNLQITTLMSKTRAESLDRLKKLIDYGQASRTELQSLARNIESLQAGCKVSYLNSEALSQIRSLLGMTEEAVLKIRQARVLDGLRFELMNERFEDIEEAYEGTFQWILDVESEEERRDEESGDAKTTSTGDFVDDDDHSTESENEESGGAKTTIIEDPVDDEDHSTDSENVEDNDSRDDRDHFLPISNITDSDNESFEWSTDTPELSDHDISEPESDLSDDEKSISQPSTSRQRNSIEKSFGPLEEIMIESRNRFVTWLKQGDGIFHVMGKPGSGKSTLMKYILRQFITQKYLRIWAGESELVVGKFFFWKPGSPIQKNLKGLVRGLLYCFLANSPELIPNAFPEQWQASMYRENIHIEHHECQKGFESLISPDIVIKKHKFVLFIDGLDEFEGNHADLIRKLFLWTNKTQSVKICISSREWSIFQEKFQDCPKLRLHDLTHLDIQRMIQGRFREMKLPSLLHSTKEPNSSNARILEEKIVEGSEGVFLWVVAVLRHIEDGLVNGDQMEDLIEVVRCFPTELEPLMYQLINSIPNANKKLAYTTLSFALFTHQFKWPTRLIQFALLEEYIKDRDFAMKQPVNMYSSAENTQRLDNARKRIYGVCKGFFELRSHFSSTRPIVISITNLFGDLVHFTHRSIVEFLKSQQFKETTQLELQNFEPFDAYIQTYLGALRYLKLPRYYFTPKLATQNRGPDLISNGTGLVTRSWKFAPSPSFAPDLENQYKVHFHPASTKNQERFFLFLDDVSRTICDLHLNTAKLTIYSSLGYEMCRYPVNDLPFLISTHFCLFEYLSRASDLNSRLLDDCIEVSMLNNTGLSMYRTPSNYPVLFPRHLETIRVLFSRKFSSDFTFGSEKPSIFDFTIARWCMDMNRYSHVPYLQLVASMLYNGMNPGVCIVLSKRIYKSKFGIARKAYFKTKVSGEEGTVKTIRFSSWRRSFKRLPDEQIVVLVGASINRITAEHGLTLDFKALVSIWFPDHAHVLREVIDWNHEIGISFDADQRIKLLQSTFGRTLRPLFDQDCPDLASWEFIPTDWHDIDMRWVFKSGILGKAF
ncbi:hypothetical protein F4781DRAFT_424459 [Annulohypoxylon bovei var. microspora]|nr:hypothetical protein F4781DRAFT_424459 [Annulohypoxylon bovei var. microspora]